MARIDIWDLEITPATAEHIWRHRVTPPQLREILDGPYVVAPNRSERTASHRLIGRDAQGRCICAPIVKTDDSGTWRVITAWHCKKSEAALLRRVE
jgi:hypothetical protein